MAWKCRNWVMVFIRSNYNPTPLTLTPIGQIGKTAAQIALRWLLQSDVIIIPKTAARNECRRI